MPDSTDLEHTPEGINMPVVEHGQEGEKQLEYAIGAQIREFRLQLKMTVSEVAKQAGLSQGGCYPRLSVA